MRRGIRESRNGLPRGQKMGNGQRSRTQRLQGALWCLWIQTNAVLLVDLVPSRRGAAIAEKIVQYAGSRHAAHSRN
jgi:hypothetical protein